FGRARDPDWSKTQDPVLQPMETRGFTGQEEDRELGLVNMGGRLYDPKIGRFTAVDPGIGAPLNSQAFDADSYVYNRPLSFVDPTGYYASWMVYDPEPGIDLDIWICDRCESAPTFFPIAGVGYAPDPYLQNLHEGFERGLQSSIEHLAS